LSEVNFDDDFLGKVFDGEVYGKRGKLHPLPYQLYTAKKSNSCIPDAIATTHIDTIPKSGITSQDQVMKVFHVIQLSR
jgi:hypothetical protein